MSISIWFMINTMISIILGISLVIYSIKKMKEQTFSAVFIGIGGAVISLVILSIIIFLLDIMTMKFSKTEFEEKYIYNVIAINEYNNIEGDIYALDTGTDIKVITRNGDGANVIRHLDSDITFIYETDSQKPMLKYYESTRTDFWLKILGEDSIYYRMRYDLYIPEKSLINEITIDLK